MHKGISGKSLSSTMPSDCFTKEDNLEKLTCTAIQILRKEGAFERGTTSAPNSRSSSFKGVRRRNLPENHTIRRNSVPDALDVLRDHANKKDESKTESGVKRVRSFKMTKKGIVNRGDSVSSRGSLCSSGSSNIRRERIPSDNSDSSTSTTCSCTSSLNTGYYKIVVFGGTGVGKRSIINQFMTSEYIGGNDAFSDQIWGDNCVSVMLDGEESTLEFCDNMDNKETIGRIQADAFVVVYSVDDKFSFEVARDAIGYLRNDLGSDRTIILVANKIDLVRRRLISPEDARSVAMEYRCKYIETSATLNHKVDELLVCVLRQIRLLLNPDTCPTSFDYQNYEEKKHSCMKKQKGLLSRLFRKNVHDAELCDNLFEL